MNLKRKVLTNFCFFDFTRGFIDCRCEYVITCCIGFSFVVIRITFVHFNGVKTVGMSVTGRWSELRRKKPTWPWSGGIILNSSMNSFNFGWSEKITNQR